MGWFREGRKHTIVKRMVETNLFEFVMNEISNGEKHQGLWGQALVACEGDTVRAEAAYIKLRVNSVKDEIQLENIIESEQIEAIQEFIHQKEKGFKQSSIDLTDAKIDEAAETSTPKAKQALARDISDENGASSEPSVRTQNESKERLGDAKARKNNHEVKKQFKNGAQYSSRFRDTLPPGERAIYAPDINFEAFPATISWFRSPGKLVRKGWTLCSLRTSLQVYQIKAPADLEISQIFVPNGEVLKVRSYKLCNIKLR